MQETERTFSVTFTLTFEGTGASIKCTLREPDARVLCAALIDSLAKIDTDRARQARQDEKES